MNKKWPQVRKIMRYKAMFSFYNGAVVPDGLSCGSILSTVEAVLAHSCRWTQKAMGYCRVMGYPRQNWMKFSQKNHVLWQLWVKTALSVFRILSDGSILSAAMSNEGLMPICP
jgi:hypothetical protein